MQIGTLLGAQNESKVREQMTAVMDFETELAKITAPSDERRDDEKLYHALTLKELQSRSPVVSPISDLFYSLQRFGNRIIAHDEIT